MPAAKWFWRIGQRSIMLPFCSNCSAVMKSCRQSERRKPPSEFLPELLQKIVRKQKCQPPFSNWHLACGNTFTHTASTNFPADLDHLQSIFGRFRAKRGSVDCDSATKRQMLIRTPAYDLQSDGTVSPSSS